MLEGHGGNLPKGKKENQIIDFSVSVNSFFSNKELSKIILSGADKLQRYPDPLYKNLRKLLAKKYGIPASSILVGNGSTELLYLLPRALKLKNILLVSPSYSDYKDAFSVGRAKIKEFYLKESDDFLLDFASLSKEAGENEVVIIGSPNNPTGKLANKKAITKLAKDNPSTLFFIDEAFIEFAPNESLIKSKLQNIIILRSLTKFYGVPGLRIGFISAHPKIIEKMLKLKEPWTLNAIAEQFAKRICACKKEEAIAVRKNSAERNRLFKNLSTIEGLRIFPSDANFLLIKILAKGLTAKKLQKNLLRDNIFIRDCSNFDSLNALFFRVAIRSRKDNQTLYRELKKRVKRQ